MNTTRSFFALLLVLKLVPYCTGQSYRVDLPQISSIDDPGLHVEVFTRVPKHPLILPDVDTTNAWFLEEFYSWDVKSYHDIAVMVIPSSIGELLYIDLNDDRKLMYEAESFALSDVIVLDSLNLKVDRVDPYGRWVQFAVTSQPATPYLVPVSQRRAQQGTSGTIDPSIWKARVKTLDGRGMSLEKYKGEYLLLNFWGEWCGPCVAEIPELVQAERTYSGKGLQIVSFLKYGDLKKAEMIIRKNGINWPQIVLSDSLEKKFNIRGYPTNILIFPDGKRYILAGPVTQLFFQNNIR